MKAVRLHRQGGPEQLVYEDAPEPELGAGDALIRVHATGITPAELTWAETYSNCDGSERLPAIPGHEVSGVVESVADGVSDVSIGDEVYALTSFCRDGAADRGGQLGLLSGERTYAEALSSRDLQHQLSSGMAGHSAFKCLSGLRQRDCFRDHRADCAGIYQRRDFAELFSIGLDDEKHSAPAAALAMRRPFALGDRPRQTDEDSRRL